MKKVVKKILAVFGYRVIKVRTKLKAAPQVANEEFAYHHNSLETVNGMYSNSKKVADYLEPARLKFYEDIVQLMASRRVVLTNKKVIDVGCGTGHLLEKLSSSFQLSSVTGLDFSEAAINLAKQVLPHADFFVHDLYNERPEKYDIILCTEVLEHLLYPEKAINTMKNMMSSGAACILTVPNGRLDTFEGHINFWSPESWSKFVNEQFSGYSIDSGTLSDGKVNFSIIVS